MPTRTEVDMARIALACLDLTSLNDDDGESRRDRAVPARRRCARAGRRPVRVAAARQRGACSMRPPACAWPRWPTFPTAATDMQRALADTARIVQAGAHEVDVVLPYRALLAGDDQACGQPVAAVRRACDGLTLKVILETGELRELRWMQRAARLALAEGADFLKTSSGKTAVSATPEAARGPAAGDRGRCARAHDRRLQGRGRHAHGGRCRALHRSGRRAARRGGAAAGALSHRRQRRCSTTSARARRRRRRGRRRTRATEHRHGCQR